MKRAIILLAGRLPADAKIVSTVHDEVIINCSSADAEGVAKTIENAMTEAMSKLYPEVPIEVEAKIADNWGDAK